MDVCLKVLQNHGWKGGKIKHNKLPARLDYHDVYRIARCLEIQLKALEDNLQKSFLFLTKDDIVDIGSGWYLIHNMENLVQIENDHITIKTIEEKVKMAPELAMDLTLPHVTHKSCVYYHIGQILVELLDIDDDLELLYGSPLYFTIQRALEPEPKKRHFLLV
jgi:hypothetical protein